MQIFWRELTFDSVYSKKNSLNQSLVISAVDYRNLSERSSTISI